MPNTPVYTRAAHCPFCEKAKELLKEKGVTFSTIVVGQDIDRDTFLADIKRLTGKDVTTVPQVFLEEEYIGGYDELKAHYEQQDLAGEFGDFDL